jgi:hypothetical protein
MRIKPGVVLVCMLVASAAMAQDMVYLEVTGSWTPANFYVQSTGPTMGARGIPQENDDMVFGVAPSAGSTTFTLLVDTSTVQYFPTGYQGTKHPWYGYNGVRVVGTHRFGTAWWTTESILTGLIGPGGARATLWTNKDLRTADPTLLSIRMFGHWNGHTADLVVGIRTNTMILETFMLAEYYNGEHLISESNAAVSILAVNVDVKPGSDDNTVGCSGDHGVIPVAILTTPQFNALDIDVATVRFGPGQAVEVHRTGPAHRDGHRGGQGRHEQDIDGDGDLDLVLHFARDAAGIVCGESAAPAQSTPRRATSRLRPRATTSPCRRTRSTRRQVSPSRARCPSGSRWGSMTWAGACWRSWPTTTSTPARTAWSGAVRTRPAGRSPQACISCAWNWVTGSKCSGLR